MLFAKFYAVISFAVAALVALFYFTGAISNPATVTLGFTLSLLMGVYLLWLFPIVYAEEPGRHGRHSHHGHGLGAR